MVCESVNVCKKYLFLCVCELLTSVGVGFLDCACFAFEALCKYCALNSLFSSSCSKIDMCLQLQISNCTSHLSVVVHCGTAESWLLRLQKVGITRQWESHRPLCYWDHFGKHQWNTSRKDRTSSRAILSYNAGLVPIGGLYVSTSRHFNLLAASFSIDLSAFLIKYQHPFHQFWRPQLPNS